MVTTNQYIVGALIITLFSLVIVNQVFLVEKFEVELSDKVKLRVTYDETTLFVKENGRWLIGGIEQHRLFDGTRRLNRRRADFKIEVFIDNVSKIIVVNRTTVYSRGPVIKSNYFFDGKLEGVEFVPLYHKETVINGTGYFYRYTVDRLSDTGPRTKLTGETELSFGKNIKVEIEPEYRWAHIGWPYGADSLSAQYNLNTDFEVFNIRLFDPPLISSIDYEITRDCDTKYRTEYNICTEKVYSKILGNESNSYIRKYNCNPHQVSYLDNCKTTGITTDNIKMSCPNNHRCDVLDSEWCMLDCDDGDCENHNAKDHPELGWSRTCVPISNLKEGMEIRITEYKKETFKVKKI